MAFVLKELPVKLGLTANPNLSSRGQGSTEQESRIPAAGSHRNSSKVVALKEEAWAHRWI